MRAAPTYSESLPFVEARHSRSRFANSCISYPANLHSRDGTHRRNKDSHERHETFVNRSWKRASIESSAPIGLLHHPSARDVLPDVLEPQRNLCIRLSICQSHGRFVTQLRYPCAMFSSSSNRQRSDGAAVACESIIMRVLIATDAWHPQVNGVVRTLSSLARSAQSLGVDIEFLSMEGFPSL